MLTTVSGRIGENAALWLEPNWPAASARGLFSLRLGGFSQGEYASMNMGLHVGDDPETVRQNRETAVQMLSVPLKDWVFAEQVHGDRVAVVDGSHRARGAFAADKAIGGVDALVTNQPGLALAILSADCVPVLFHDPVARVVAAAHSGWKGTAAHIVRNVIDTMTAEFGSQPANIWVALGPSIRQCCYEVDERVAQAFQEEFGQSVLVPQWQQTAHYMLSLQGAISQDLIAAGVPSSQVEDVGLCTGCRTQWLFSHRVEQGRTGRLMGAVCLV